MKIYRGGSFWYGLLSDKEYHYGYFKFSSNKIEMIEKLPLDTDDGWWNNTPYYKYLHTNELLGVLCESV